MPLAGGKSGRYCLLMLLPTRDSRGRVFRPGLRRVGWVGSVIVIWALLAACGSSRTETYGGLPSFLPKSTVPVNHIVDASEARPKLGIEGDTIAATLKRGHVLITIVGPEVPVEGLSPPPPTTPATFTVTMSQPGGNVPVGANAFIVVDGQGQIHHPQLMAATSPVPSTAPAGRTISFKLTAVLATGPGTIQWTPEGAAVASWDFTVETD